MDWTQLRRPDSTPTLVLSFGGMVVRGQYDFTPRPPRTTITRSAGSRCSSSGCSPLAFLAWLDLLERSSSQCSPRDHHHRRHDISVQYRCFTAPYCKEKSKGGRGRDLVLAYHNHSEVPVPPDIHSGDLDRN
ncbi:hypothetical protein T265_07765 [Opisthorchis viverrini]|uniref:Uncharacterized protein n=1 Tax=Opisthorchis viverrini TaxID=6198 RepID=A0A075AAN9_OPIVI|nr:hypothetical protein T265_07765 [Opisthorchis viverrini]KER24624.1 hypothetical protein T265_07765 [Opisthorchis viverrini]